jgi:aminoglycoside phosphotransferase (APT) family kinase protein
MTVLELASRDGLRRVVVRAHGEFDRARDPDLAEHEFELLRALENAGIDAPRALWFDASATLLPTPYLVVDYIDGSPVLETRDPLALAREMARSLAAIHRLDVPVLDWLPDVADRVAWLLARTGPDEFEARAALERHWPPAVEHPGVLLHGDFWPGNLLWRGDRLVGVIDWEDAAQGTPLADVAIARLELLWLWGERAMDAFTAHYAASTAVDLAALPLWDLHAVLRPAGRWNVWFPDRQKRRRALQCAHAFAERALAEVT